MEERERQRGRERPKENGERERERERGKQTHKAWCVGVRVKQGVSYIHNLHNPTSDLHKDGKQMSRIQSFPALPIIVSSNIPHNTHQHRYTHTHSHTHTYLTISIGYQNKLKVCVAFHNKPSL